ncbi:HAD family hydrolase [Salinifilum ghardaiensis]
MPQNLLFDADDTLWENNVLFERAVERVLDEVAGPDLPREQLRAQLDAIEAVNSRRHGYGVDVFERSLGECLAVFREPDEADRRLVTDACAPIRQQRVELLDGVRGTLHELHQRHRLFLVTKGDRAEQSGKVDVSGLAGFFDDVVIVPEKDAAVYADFVEERRLDAARTWMIGNSPRSDIWPALEAGIGAVLVPHPMTWSLETEEVPEGHARFRAVEAFPLLREHF